MENDLKHLWKNILATIETEISKGSFLALFKSTSLLSLEENPSSNQLVANICVPSTIIIDMIKKKHITLLKTAIKKQTKKDTDIIFVPKSPPVDLRDIKNSPLFVSDIKDLEEKVKPQPLKTSDFLPRLRNDYTFQTLAVSGSNQLAYVAASTVTKNPGSSYNPLFLYGPSGVGKTHLMHAIANEILQKQTGMKIIYKTSEEFTNEVVEAIRSNQTHGMKKKFRSADVFIIDDVQFIAGKDRVQEELFHTFNILIDKGVQIVLSSDRPPYEIKKLEKRLSSRFSGGLTVDIEPPDFELRCAILLIKAKKYGYDLPIDIAKIIAQDIEDTRYLEGALLRLITEATTKGLTLTDSLAQKSLKTKTDEQKQYIRPDEIIKHVCLFYNIKSTQIKGEKRDAFLVKARQICMYLLKNELGLPYVEIGNLLGGRDHTTIMYGCGKIEQLLMEKPALFEEIKGITKNLSG